MLNIEKRKLLRYIILYSAVTLLIITFFIIHLQFTDLSKAYLVILVMAAFFAFTELIDKSVGIFIITLSIMLELMRLSYGPPEDPIDAILFIILLIALTVFLNTVKNLRTLLLDNTSEREKHFRSLVNFSPQPIILKNNKGEVIFTSDTIKELLGLKNNLPAGESIEQIIHPEHIKDHQDFMSSVLDKPYEKQTIELRMKKNDNWIWVRNDSVNLLKHKNIRAVVSSIQDITFQKEIDREKADIIIQEKNARNIAENAVRQRDEFLAIASHELKTPLTTILLQLQATLRRILTQSLADFSGSELLNSLQIAENQSHRLTGLINDLLNVSIASSGKLSLNKELVNLGRLTESLIHRYEREISLSGSNVELVLKNANITGEWDPIRIEQALSNLLLNALKYSNGENVRVVVTNDEAWGMVSIIDSGKGIAEKFHDSLFEPFKRLSVDKKTEGLGVGLFIAKQIALSHGGDIDLKSKVGKGSTFTLKLPLKQNGLRA
jgi:PAS domain S-box-containing protein